MIIQALENLFLTKKHNNWLGSSSFIVDLKQVFAYRQNEPLEALDKKGALENFGKFTGKELRPAILLKKEALTQVLSCQFYEIFKNTLSIKYLQLLLLYSACSFDRQR